MTSKISEFIASEKMNEIINKQIETSISGIFKDTFCSYSDTTKAIKKHIESSIKIDFQQIELAEYNVMITDMLKVLIHKHMKEAAEVVLVKEIEKILAPAPKELTVQGLLDILLEEWRDEAREDCCSDFDDHAKVEIKESKYSKSKTIKMWKKEKTSSYSSLNTPDLDIYILESGKISMITSAKQNFGTINYGAEAQIYQMYAAGTIVTDAQDIDVYDLELWIRDYN